MMMSRNIMVMTTSVMAAAIRSGAAASADPRQPQARDGSTV